MNTQRTFLYNDIEWIYFPEFILQNTTGNGKDYLFLYQNDITQERTVHQVNVKDFVIDYIPDDVESNSSWRIIGFCIISEKEKPGFNWSEYTNDSKFEVGDYEILVEDGISKPCVMYTYYNGKKFDVNTEKLKILEYRKAQYSENMPIEQGVYRVTIYNKYTNTRRTVPVYMINNKFIFENGLVVGDSIHLVSECLTKWVDTHNLTMANAFTAVLGIRNNSDIAFIIDNDLFVFNNRYQDCIFTAIYKNNSRCKLGLSLNA